MINGQSDQPSSRVVAARHQARFIEDLLKEKNVKLSSSRRQGLVEVRELTPTFLAKFYEAKYPVIVVSAKKIVEVVKVPTLSKKVEQAKEEFLEVTGTPLESPFTAEDLNLLNPLYDPVAEIEQKYEPLTNEHARVLLMKFAETVGSMCRRHEVLPEEVAPVFVVCDGSDGKHLVLLQSESNGTSRAARMFASREFKCGEQKMLDLRRMAQLNTRVFCWPGGKVYQMPKIECVRYLEFGNLAQAITLSDGTSVEEDSGLKVKVIWKVRGDDFDTTPPFSAVSTLEAPLMLEYVKWDTGVLHPEIALLVELVACTKDEALAKEHVLPSLPGGELDSNISVLAKQIVDISRAKPALLDIDEGPTNTHNSAEPAKKQVAATLTDFVTTVNNESRPNMDLTDVMWNKFKHCKTVGEVGEGLLAVLEECLSTKPYIQPSNITEIAKISLQLNESRERWVLPNMSATRMAELLLEIGYTKLCRDFSFLCEASGLRGGTETRQACGASLTGWEERVHCLERVHHVLELVLKTQSQLGLGLEASRLLFDKALSNQLDHVKVNLPSEHLMPFLTTTKPQLRRWSYKSINDTTKCTVVSHFVSSRHPLLPWVAPELPRLRQQPADEERDADSSLLQQETLNDVFCATLHYIVNP